MKSTTINFDSLNTSISGTSDTVSTQGSNSLSALVSFISITTQIKKFEDATGLDIVPDISFNTATGTYMLDSFSIDTDIA